jgi:hypothetical protein
MTPRRRESSTPLAGVRGQAPYNHSVAVSRAERRRDREPRVRAVFNEALVPATLDVLELLEYAWHDCYGEITPDEAIIDDILLLSRGQLDKLVGATKLALLDRRDLIMAVDALRNSSGST